jgi:hydrogenase maturation protease
VVVIGVGNEYRRDDGIGPAVVAELAHRGTLDGRLVLTDGEPTQLLDAWHGAELAVLIDAVRCEPADPGRIHRITVNPELSVGGASTHGLGVPEAIRLAQVLDRAPRRLVVYAVEAGDLGFGVGLTEQVADVVPTLAQTVLDELHEAGSSRH